ncbi:Mu transposase C-terminal domain-containing protein [Aquitalea sp.]|uniref:Mu transposase C-terminal domain-containing protein n=1 Tax=Aquitalea sp. TaxID=1872623 RepID=UPI00258C3581|nr:Mu transposase C-terminal domain-containing protein [Aquitalea sp.]
MTGFTLRSGMAFEWNGVAHRIERLTPQQQVLVLREIDGQIGIYAREELLTAYRDGCIQIAQTAVPKQKVRAFSRPLADLPPHMKTEVSRRLAYLQALEAMGSFVTTPHCLKPVIEQVASRLQDSSPPSTTTLYRWHRRFQIAQDVRALIPRYDRRGSSALRQPDKVLELFTQAVQEAFDASPAANVRSIYDRLRGKVDRENQLRQDAYKLVLPTLRTVYRMLRRVEAYDFSVLKNGQTAADKRFQIFKKGPKVEHILQRVEIDHTPLDYFLIDDLSRLPLGRPTLTILIDVYSRFPIGYFISFGTPSVEAVVAALRHAILPKRPATPVVPDVTVEHAWPCYGLIGELVCDNGLEFHGPTLESIALDLGIVLLFCPKHQPRFKGVVERFLKTVNYNFAHQLPGTSLARFTQRGDYDPQKHAVLTLGEFTHMFEKWLLDIYAQTVHRGIQTTPWAKWHEGLERMTPELPGNIEDLRTRIGKVDIRKLRQDGIHLQGIRYAGPTLEPILRSWGSGTPVRIVYDPSDLGSILVWSPGEEDPVVVEAVDPGYAKGLTEYQHKLIREMIKEKGETASNAQALAESRFQLATATDELVRSRKLRQRKKGARINGASSAQPEARMSAPLPARKTSPKPPVINPEKSFAPSKLPTFHLDQKKDRQ